VLVLSRKAEQSLIVGDDIVISVLGIEGERVKLGIEAPRSVRVLRAEVFQQVRSANEDAAVRGARPSVHNIAAAIRNRVPAATIS
jgi:carbon storage regulator